MTFIRFIFIVYLNIYTIVNGIKLEDLLRVKDVNQESAYIDSVLKTEINSHAKKENYTVAKIENYKFAGGMVSVDCLRCLCLKQSNCRPLRCHIREGLLDCGYFRLTHAFWDDCGIIGSDWRKCASDITCASQCVQNYIMKHYAKRFNCQLNCEGYSREFGGGPNGCNNPRTVPFWIAVQKQPGCKGVE